MKIFRPSQAQRGVTLIECIVYLGLLFLIAGFVTQAYYQLLEHSVHMKQRADQIARLLQVGEHWRREIREATGPIHHVPTPGGYQLHIPRNNTEIIYSFHHGTLSRKENVDELPAVLAARIPHSEMIRDQRGSVTAWRWEIELPSRRQIARVRPHFTFQAVPGFSSFQRNSP